MKKLFLVGVVIFIAAFTIFAGGNEEATEASDSAMDVEVEDQGVVVEAVEEESSRAFDFGGKTVTISHMWDQPMFAPEGDQYEHLLWIEEYFNVNIELIVVPGYDPIESIISGVAGGDPVADVFFIQSPPMMARIAKEGALYPITDIYDETYFAKLPSFKQDFAQKYGTFNGELYFIPQNELILMEALLFNKRIFEEEGLPDLYELVANDEWTFDVLKEIAVSATKDFDGDGVIDQYGFADYIPPFTAINMMLANGVELVSQDADGNYIASFNTPEAVEAVQMLQDFHVIHNTSPEMFLPSLEATDQGKTAIIAGDYTLLSRFADLSVDEYGIVPYPRGPNGQMHSNTKRLHGWVLPSVLDHDPAALVELVCALYKLNSDYMDMETFEEDWYIAQTSMLMDDGSFDTFDWLLENVEVLSLWEDIQMWGGLFGLTTTADKTVAAGLAEHEPIAQTVLNEMFKQE